MRRRAVLKFYKQLTFSQFQSSNTHTMLFKNLAMSLVVVLFALVGLTGYAYASPNVTHGDSLYGLKRSVESVRVKMANSHYEKVQVHTDLAMRRLAEAKVLAKEQNKDLSEVLSFLGIDVAHAAEDTSTTTESETEVDVDVETETEVEVTTTSTEDQMEDVGEDEEEASDDLSETVEDMMDEMEQAEQAAEEMEDENMSAELELALSLIIEAQSQQIEGLVQVAAILGVDASEGNIEAVALALDEIADGQAQIAQLYSEVQLALAAKNSSDETTTSTDQQTDDSSTDETSTSTEDQTNEDNNEAAEEETDEDANEEEEEVNQTEIQLNLSVFKEQLLQSGVDEGDAEKLFSRLEKKANQIDESLEKGNGNKAKGLEKAFHALKNNAKHFAKQNNGEKQSADEDQEESDEQNSEESEENTSDTSTSTEDQTDDSSSNDDSEQNEDDQSQTDADDSSSNEHGDEQEENNQTDESDIDDQAENEEENDDDAETEAEVEAEINLGTDISIRGNSGKVPPGQTKKNQ